MPKPIKRFVLRDDSIKRNAIAFIDSMNVGGKVLEVVIQPHKRDRSTAQNALMWQWVTIIANELGHSKTEQHEQFKRFYLLPILMRDDPDVDRLARVLGHERDNLALVLSTTDLNTKQFTEYLNDIAHFAGELGIMLPHPEDTYYEAMGVRHG